MSDSVLSHGLQYTRLPCPSPSTGICSNSSPLSWWWHPSISPSVTPFFSYHQSIPVSGSFPVNWLFASGGQSIGDSVSASVLPMNIQDWFFFSINWFDLLAVQWALKSLLYHHSLKALTLWWSTFFMVQLSHLYRTTVKTTHLTI